MAYKSTRRQWVKLWVNEWLDGTSRFELTAPQRLLWIDLLALAGRSRFPGFIYAGLAGDGSKVGYPIAYLAGVLQMDEVTLNNALKLLQEHCHITLDESAPENYVIGIINWEKYQSEYLRQRAYRKVTTKTTSRLPVEGEVEVEVEGEGEVKTHIACAPLGSAEFKTFFEAYPVQTGRKAALHEWCKQRLDSLAGEVMLSLSRWKSCERWQDPQYIPYPAKWLSDQWRSEPVKGVSKDEQKRQRTKQAIERVRARLVGQAE